MRTVTLTGEQRLQPSDLQRAGALPREVMDAAQAIVDDVRERGDEAVREYCLKFDGACPESFRVPDEVVKAAPARVDPAFLEALQRATGRFATSTSARQNNPGSRRATTARSSA